ncbi:MAG: exonuclease domain-containing protein [Actinomycetes bacterium]
MAWPTTFVGFDLETTGTDVVSDRIVSAALVEMDSHSVVKQRDWLVDPGIDIPAQSTAVHGISTEQVQRDGRPAEQAVQEIVLEITQAWDRGVPVVIYNAAFDVPVIVNEAHRYGLELPLAGVVLDPLVVWRELERYRPGKKRLQDAVDRFGLQVEAAHEAVADAKAAVEVMFKLVELGSLANVELASMMELQQDWHKAWAENFREWLADRGGDISGISLSWPV